MHFFSETMRDIIICCIFLSLCLEYTASNILFNPVIQGELSNNPIVGQPDIPGYIPKQKNGGRRPKNRNKGKKNKKKKTGSRKKNKTPKPPPPVPTPEMSGEHEKEISYLIQYGYLYEGDGNKDKAITDAVKLFQGHWGLTVTGEIDESVINLMNQPRCGCKDFELDSKTGKRRIHKRFAVHPLGGWKNRNLTFRILPIQDKMLFSFNGGLEMPRIYKSQKLKAIRKAFRAWERVSTITFTEVFDNRPVVMPDIIVDDPFDDHIDVLFAAYDHGDPIPFDGRLGALGHAFWPAFGGDLHLDESELWDLGKPLPAVDLFQVVLHELGHALGLGHTNVFEAIMYPFYRLRENVQFDSDDIDGLKFLYP